MSTVRIKGDTSGYVDLATGNNDGNLNVTSSAANGEMFVDTGKGVRVKGTGVSGLIVDADPDDASVSSRLVLRNGTDAGAAYYISTSGWVFNTGSVVGSTSGTPRVYFNNDGVVRMPYQPAFRAGFPSPDGTNTIGSGDVYAASVAPVNVGSHYNTSNYRFVAPVPGSYWFAATAWISSNAPNEGSIAFRVNGSEISAGTGDRIVAFNDGNGNSTFVSLSALLYLNANDYVTMNARNGGSVYYSGHTWWNGYLVG